MESFWVETNSRDREALNCVQWQIVARTDKFKLEPTDSNQYGAAAP